MSQSVLPRCEAGSSEQRAWELDPADIKMLERLGCSIEAEVFHARFKGRDVAVKMPDRQLPAMTSKQRQSFQQDLQVMMGISHPNLVNFVGVVSEQTPFKIVTEYCTGGCMFELLHNCEHVDLVWSQKLKMASDITSGMEFLHKLDPPIIHQDLKSLNTLLMRPVNSESDVPHVKVCDFGLQRLNDHMREHQHWGRRKMIACSSHWQAPEIIAYRGSPCNEKSDIYAYAMILFEVTCREIPFEDEEPLIVPRLVSQGARPDLDAVPPDCPEALRDLMIVCWAQDPEQRPSFEHCSGILAAMMVSVVVTLHLHHEGTTLSCISLGGNELTSIDIHDASGQTLGEIRSSIADAHRADCTGQPKLMLPSGQLVNSDCDSMTIDEVFAIAK